jgi:hypothetical protein
MPKPTSRLAELEDVMKALNANVRAPLATQVLRMLGVCAVTFVLAASPAMAAGTARASFTVGITVQSTPIVALTPEQLNERNKMLYEEQKRDEATTLRVGALDSAAVSTSAGNSGETGDSSRSSGE